VTRIGNSNGPVGRSLRHARRAANRARARFQRRLRRRRARGERRARLLVFALLAAADLPVLRAIRLPVALGVIANFVLALVLTRAAAPRAAG
jgi:hypothetical protein